MYNLKVHQRNIHGNQPNEPQLKTSYMQGYPQLQPVHHGQVFHQQPVHHGQVTHQQPVQDGFCITCQIFHIENYGVYRINPNIIH